MGFPLTFSPSCETRSFPHAILRLPIFSCSVSCLYVILYCSVSLYELYGDGCGNDESRTLEQYFVYVETLILGLFSTLVCHCMSCMVMGVVMMNPALLSSISFMSRLSL